MNKRIFYNFVGGLAIYVVSYLFLVVKVPGHVYADKVAADPAIRFLKYPLNVKIFLVSLYKPLILLDKKLRPEHWWWVGKLDYETTQ